MMMGLPFVLLPRENLFDITPSYSPLLLHLMFISMVLGKEKNGNSDVLIKPQSQTGVVKWGVRSMALISMFSPPPAIRLGALALPSPGKEILFCCSLLPATVGFHPCCKEAVFVALALKT